MNRAGAIAGLMVLLVLSGCTGKSSAGSAATPSGTPSGQPPGLGASNGEQSSAPRSTIITTPKPSLSTPGGVKEVTGSCPYISDADFAFWEGDRVGRVTVLESVPVGCRFYFAYDDSAVIGEIDRQSFKTTVQAYNAMVLSAKGHPEVQSQPAIGDGAVAFQTALQGTNAWQCVFAKGTSVVTVRTRQPSPALNAFNLAKVIAPKIK